MDTRSALYNSAKNVPRAAFDAQDPMVRITYIITLAKCFNALAMIQRQRLYYSVPESSVTEQREIHRQQRCQPSDDLKEIEASSVSDESTTVTPEKSGAVVTPTIETTSSQVTSVLYPSPYKFKRPVDEPTPEEMKAFHDDTSDFIGDQPCCGHFHVLTGLTNQESY